MKTDMVHLPNTPMVQQAMKGRKHGDAVSVHAHGRLHMKDGKIGVEPSEVECDPMDTDDVPGKPAAPKSPKPPKGPIGYVLAQKAKMGQMKE